jgi:hypothetical protein
MKKLEEEFKKALDHEWEMSNNLSQCKTNHEMNKLMIGREYAEIYDALRKADILYEEAKKISANAGEKFDQALKEYELSEPCR